MPGWFPLCRDIYGLVSTLAELRGSQTAQCCQNGQVPFQTGAAMASTTPNSTLQVHLGQISPDYSALYNAQLTSQSLWLNI